MFLRSLLWCTKVAAFSVLFASVPSLLGLEKSRALLVSLALVAFYFAKGVASLVMDPRDRRDPSRMRDFNRTLGALEVPICLLICYGASGVLPGWMARPYELVLVLSGPVFTVLEGVCASLLIYCLGKCFMSCIQDCPFALKVLCMAVFGGVLLGCCLVIGNVYLSLDVGPGAAT